MIKIYTDGSCDVRTRIGGWACILIREGKKDLSYKGSAVDTTSQRMELQAVIEGIKQVGDLDKELEIYSDSNYIINAFNKGWLRRWAAFNFTLADGEKRVNHDLWSQLLTLADKYNVKWIKVKGHSSDVYNNKCDWLAGMERRKREGKEVG